MGQQKSEKLTSTQAGAHMQAPAWRHHHILDLDDLSSKEIEIVLQTTDAMTDVEEG